MTDEKTVVNDNVVNDKTQENNEETLKELEKIDETELENKLNELTKRLDELNKIADNHRFTRDRLNDETKRWVEQRDKLNDEVSKLLDEAAKHRENRDTLNDEVQHSKKERDIYSNKIKKLSDTISKLKHEKMPKNGTPVGKLRKELKNLEFKQMTLVLTKEKERELIELISRLQAEIRRKEDELENDPNIKDLKDQLEDAKQKANEWHKKVKELVDQAQVEHEEMLKIYEKVGELRKKADESQENFVKSKFKADEEHKKHIDCIMEVRDIEKLITGIKKKLKLKRKKISDVEGKKHADEILQRFMKGEKLSTEDLLLLQKRGKA